LIHRRNKLARTAKRVNAVLIVAVIFAGIGSAALLGWVWVFNARSPDPGGGEVLVQIPEGASLRQIANLLAAERLIKHPFTFRLAARIYGVDKRIMPGSYLISRGLKNTELLRMLQKPMIRSRYVTIPEGLTTREIAGLLRKSVGTDSAEFVRLCSDAELAWSLTIPAKGLEGYLFPDTYDLLLNSPPQAVIERLVDRFFEVVNDSFQIRMRMAGMSLHEAVTLASIIEGEVQIGEEAPLVSAVYHNRLRKRMALEADPTIQYVLPDGPRRLRHSDLQMDSPYNTYRHPGLPPGPINNPGRRSLKAAIEPANVDYLYFVAQGDGSHAFNRDYSGHLQSKQKLDRIRREYDREQREEG